MRPLVITAPLVGAALLAGCSVDSIQGPAPSASPTLRAAHADRGFTFTTIEVPGAVSTSASGINARGDIVGTYVDASFRSHGFLLRDGGFTTIDYPGAAGNDARGISPSGEIVGGYWMPLEPGVNIHGYLRTKDGDFERVDYPGHTNTIPQRILPDRTILGCRHDHNTMDTMRGVVMARDGNSEIDVFASMHNGATPNGRRVAGLYTNMDAGNRTEGYLIEDGVFTSLLVPGSNFTAVWDMNPAGDIVGIYRNASGFHGFLLRGDRYLSIDVDVPGTTATRAFGMNAGGAIVGSFVAGGRTRGFLATPN